MSKLLTALIALAFIATPALATPTHLMLRARAHDAKFIGTAMGGVRMTLVDVATGKVLASGDTAGGTGDTPTLIVRPQVRGAPLAGGDAAGFAATIDIDRPTLVRLEARGPLGNPSARASVTATRWLLPGQDLGGDGWIVEMPGLAVEPGFAGGRITAKVTMLCGCPVEPGGHWDANAFAVQAKVTRKGFGGLSLDLAYAGAPSQFAASAPPLPPGKYHLLVTALDKASGDVGVTQIEVTVPRNGYPASSSR